MIKLKPLTEKGKEPEPRKMISLPAEPELAVDKLRQVLDWQGYLLVNKKNKS